MFQQYKYSVSNLTFKLDAELLSKFKKICKPVTMSKVLRGLVKAFVDGKIKQDDLDLED